MDHSRCILLCALTTVAAVENAGVGPGRAVNFQVESGYPIPYLNYLGFPSPSGIGFENVAFKGTSLTNPYYSDVALTNIIGLNYFL